MYKKGLLKCYYAKSFCLLSIMLCCGFMAFAQETLIISGAALDSTDNNPLTGVSVLVKGTTLGTVTDADGHYSIAASSDATLVFRRIGYLQKEVVVGNRHVIDVELSPADQKLNQVVVVGYGTQKKSSVTAAISTLQGDKIASVPLTNLSNGLAGRIPGVIAKQISGEPGNDRSNIYIRGLSSIGNSQPLLIVDGIPRDFQQLDPNTIATITVLKDAAAVAPYGVGGANGVILVTTKKGESGVPKLTYNGYVGFQNPVQLPNYVNGYQFALLKDAAASNAGLPLPYTNEDLQKFKDGSDPDVFPNEHIFDKIITKNAFITYHNLELSGGTDRVKYYTSVGYRHQDGMWKTTNDNRYNLSLSLDVQATKTTKISTHVSGIIENARYASVNTGRIFELAGFATPLYGPAVFSNGMYGNHVMGSIFDGGYGHYSTDHLYSQLSVEQRLPFIPGLKIKGTIAFDVQVGLRKVWTTPVHVASIDTTKHPYVITNAIFSPQKASLDEGNSINDQLTYQAGLDYNRSFGKNNVSALALFEAKGNNSRALSAGRVNYVLLIDELNTGSTDKNDWSNSGNSGIARQVGLVYRLTYDYDGKYLLEATGRYDGSYYFAPGHQFGFFPAFSLGWRLSEENFIKQNLPWIDELKIRGSYGESGALAGGPFQYLSTYNVLGTVYAIGGNAVQGIGEGSEANTAITWERAKKIDIGLDATLWKGLLSIEADYFHGKRSNMLVSPNVTVPAEYGIGLSQENAGIMENSGVDFSISSAYRISNDLQVSLAGNFTYAKNKLLQVFETGATYDNPNRRRTGKPYGTQFGYQAMGFFQESDFDGSGDLKSGIAKQPWGAVQPGDIRYKDINKDGKIDQDDIVVIGSPRAYPGIIYGISPTISFRGFDLNLLFQGAAKTDFYYEPETVMPFWNTMTAYVDNFDYWTPDHTNARNPRLTPAPTTNNSQVSSFWMTNASYLRLKSATLAYTLPMMITQKAAISNARIYLSGQNILTWTKMRNYDPELGPNNSYMPNGGWSYPNQQVLTIGLNATF